MPVPKRKKSKSKRDKRRTHQNEATLPHHACPSCGYYKGRKVVETEED
jgi:large subunit ribosomal protein L32